MQTQPANVRHKVADAQRGNWVDRYAPAWLKPYARLARWDRPIGFWLLFWPCAMSLALAAVARPMIDFNWLAAVLCLAGAIAMRGAGCTFNDIVDRKIDEKVSRTRSRPIPSGQVSVRQAVAFLVVQALVGLMVLVQFNAFAIWLGVASLLLVAIYPFMKRITWWPQLFLGLAFSWGALMGWAVEFGSVYPPVFSQDWGGKWFLLSQPALLLYAGCVVWTIGYDTIYALQDIEDDSMIGVKSTARLFGKHARSLVGLFYTAAFALWLWAGFAASAGTIFLVASIPAAGILAWQVITLDAGSPANSLKRFKANHYAGLALTLALWLQFRF